MIPYEWLEEADARIAAHIKRTPLTFDAKRNLYIKWDNQQVTGSFKVRGALNKVLSLPDRERANGIVTASAGNHGLGTAFAASLTQSPVTVFVSEHAVPAKIEAMQALGASVHKIPGGFHQAEAAGKTYAADQQQTWVSAYNDPRIVAGQGTLSLEIMRQLPEDAQIPLWLVPVSGGGLIAGAGLALEEKQVNAKLIGIQAAASPFTHAIYYQGSQQGVQDLPTLADGLAGAVEDDAITIPLIKRLVDDVLLITEEDLERAIAFAWFEYGEKIEGSGAVGLAAVLTGMAADRPAVAVVSGGNIQPEVHAALCKKYAEEEWN